MGYQTKYDLESNPSEDLEPATRLLQALADYEYLFEDHIKWYSHKEDMLAMSTSFPETLFTLRGEGEESGDEWVLYVKNGKSQRYAREDWTPPPPDPGAWK
jgi:hypothetical protein